MNKFLQGERGAHRLRRSSGVTFLDHTATCLLEAHQLLLAPLLHLSLDLSLQLAFQLALVLLREIFHHHANDIPSGDAHAIWWCLPSLWFGHGGVFDRQDHHHSHAHNLVVHGKNAFPAESPNYVCRSFASAVD
jgi:hypothetical protein